MTKQTKADAEEAVEADTLTIVGDNPEPTDLTPSSVEADVEDGLSIVADDSAPSELVPSAEASKPRVKGATVMLVEEPAPIIAEEVEVRRPGKGEVTLTYRGAADLLEYGDYRFRPDQPVIVPSDVAEELLTLPFEQFEKEKE